MPTKKPAQKKPASKKKEAPSKKPISKKKEVPSKEAVASSPLVKEEDQDVVLITSEGLKALKLELDELKTVKRREVAERLKEAISYGDLSENSEYEEAKNEQAFVEGRVLELEQKVKHAKIIAGKKASVVRIGSTVVIADQKTKEKETYTIVGSTEADPMSARISNESPVGKALLGQKKGDTVDVKAPGGEFEYRIVSLK